MEKKNLQPQQKQPVVRQSIAKPTIEGLLEEQLTVGWSGGGAISPSMCGLQCNKYPPDPCFACGCGPFAGDDAE